MITMMKTGPHISVLCTSAAENEFLEQDENNRVGLINTKIVTDHKWHKNTSWTLVNPAEIESFFKIGADLTVSVLSHVCGSRFREITLCALKASVLSQPLTQWSLDRLCFAEWNEDISVNVTEKCWLNSHFRPICLRVSVLYWGYQRCTSGYQRKGYPPWICLSQTPLVTESSDVWFARIICHSDQGLPSRMLQLKNIQITNWIWPA